MRLRIQSFAPLPVVKVWFTPDEHDCVTVAGLKSALAREVLASTAASALDLSLDGFDLLDSSALGSVLRDGDLVLVKAGKPLEVIKKRKRSPSLISSPPRKRPLPSLSSSSSSDASESDSDDESDSSSSSSDSSASSSSSSTSNRVLVPKTQTASRTFVKVPNNAAPSRLVPPGKGKPSTHSRNKRRRTKRAATVATSAAPPNFISDANATVPHVTPPREVAQLHGPASDVAAALNNAFCGNETLGRLDPGTLPPGSPQSVSSSTLHTPLYPLSDAEETLNVQMMSMIPKSKNKNKSRRAAQDIDPRSRKIVFDEEEPQVRPAALIPPSSLPPDLIPANIFITSVDVEEGLRKPPKRQKHRAEDESMDNIVLNYGDEPALDSSMLDIDAAPVITSHEQLKEGCIIGFSGLLVNMKTFTPEMGKRHGRVLSWMDGVSVTIRPIYDGEEFDDDEDLEWTEVVGTWKLLQ